MGANITEQVKYTETTKEIQITVFASYVPEKSSPEKNYYFFAYKVKIKNLSQTAAQLLSRHWIITDGKGNVEEVEGPGVVGEQPVINPGDEFEYVSACPLATPTGNMRGTYLMVNVKGEKFLVTIPVFFLRTEVFH